MLRILRLTAVFAVVAAIVFAPAVSSAGRLWDCLFGPTPPSITTYSPPFLPAQVVPAAPAPAVVAPSYCAPCCEPSCPPAIDTACAPCVPQTYYMPTVVYRALYPATWTTYRPWRSWRVVSGYPATTYRPFQGTYETRLVPYSTYRAVFVPQATYYLSPVPCVSYPPCTDGVLYGAPASGCASCSSAAPATASAPPSATESPAASQTPPKTFRQESEKPAVEGPDLKPIPQTEHQLNSSPVPLLPDPNNRTAAMPLRKIESRGQEQGRILRTVSYLPQSDDEGWRPARQ